MHHYKAVIIIVIFIEDVSPGQPPVFASDAEVNIVTVILLCPDGEQETIRAYREESRALREYIRNLRQNL